MRRSWIAGYGILDESAGEGGIWFASPAPVSAIADYADPRQGTILNPDNDITGVNPRLGSILYPGAGITSVDPRLGSILFPDVDPTGVDPRMGTVVG